MEQKNNLTITSDINNAKKKISSASFRPTAQFNNLFFDSTLKSIHHIIEYDNPDLKCEFCSIAFPNIQTLQAHLLTQAHPNEWTPELTANPVLNCIKCFCELSGRSIHTHRCMSELADKIRLMMNQINTTCGPLNCMSCRGRTFQSRIHLQIHVIIAHSSHREPNACSICGTQFKTTDIQVHEMHAITQHLPDLAILQLKVLSNALKVQADATKPFVCLFPNQLYDKGTYKRKNCTLNFASVVDYTAHFICYHSSFYPPNPIYREECRRCRVGFNDEFSYKQHVQERHIPEFTKRVRTLNERKRFCQQLDAEKTCFLCFTIFPNALAMHVHCLVSHATECWRICGLCKTEFTDENDSLSYPILWRTIQSHEAQHVRIIRGKKTIGHLLKTPSLVKQSSVASATVPPQRTQLPCGVKLFVGKYVPGQYQRELVEGNDLTNDDILTKEMRQWFINIGEKNGIAQDELDDDFK